MFEKNRDVVFDTCVLFPPTFRDVIVQLALNGCVNLRIPTIVLYELERVLSEKGHLDDVAARRATKKLAESFLRRTDIQPMNIGDEGILEYCASNQIRTLVTENVRDFPVSDRLTVLTFSDFLISLNSQELGCLSIAVTQLTSRYTRPRMTEVEYLDKLEKIGLGAVSRLLKTSRTHSQSAGFTEHPHL